MEPDPRDVPDLNSLAQRVNAAKARILAPNNRSNSNPPRRLAVQSPVAGPSRAVSRGRASSTAAVPTPPRPRSSSSTSMPATPESKYDSDASQPTPVKRARIQSEEQAKTNWKEMKEEKKKLKEKRKRQEKGGELYDMEREAKSIWEDLRRKDCPADRQLQLSGALFDLVKNNLPELMRTHDMSRVIETLMVKGTHAMRDAVMNLCRTQQHLCWNKYSCHVVLKAVVNANPEQKKNLLEIFRTWFPVLMSVPRSRDLAEVIFESVNNEQYRLKCISVMYGGRYAMPDFDIRTKNSAFAIPNPTEYAKSSEAAKMEMTANFRTVYKDIVDRRGNGNSKSSAMKYSMFHFFLTEYLCLLGEEERSRVFEEINLAENFFDFLTTRRGVGLVINFFWESPPKVRKAVVKSLKGRVTDVACMQFGHLLLLGILDSLDDTTLASKVIITELVRNMSLVMGNLYGRKVIRYLIDHRNKTDFSPDILDFLRNAGANSQSKKDMPTRWAELRKFANDELLDGVIEHAKTWVTSSQQASVLASIMMFAKGPKIELAGKEIIRQITSEQKTFTTIQNGGTFSMVKRLIGHIGKVDVVQKHVPNIDDKFDPPVRMVPASLQERSETFAKNLVESFTKKSMKDWLESPQGCAILKAILDVWGNIKEIRTVLLEKIQLCPYAEILEREMTEVKSKANLYKTLLPLVLGVNCTGANFKSGKLMVCKPPEKLNAEDFVPMPDEINQERMQPKANRFAMMM